MALPGGGRTRETRRAAAAAAAVAAAAAASGGPVATQARVSCTDCDQLTHSSGFLASDEAMLFRVFTKEIAAGLQLPRMMAGSY